jgi:hypothetical protein
LATLENLYPTGYFRAIGNTTGWWTDMEHWDNKTFDEYVDKMRVIAPEDPNTLVYFRNAMTIWLQQLPGIPLLFKPTTTVTSQTYWKGWPTSANPYIQPLYHWPNFLFTLLKLTKGAGPISTPTPAASGFPPEWVAVIVVAAVAVIATMSVLLIRERQKKRKS